MHASTNGVVPVQWTNIPGDGEEKVERAFLQRVLELLGPLAILWLRVSGDLIKIGVRLFYLRLDLCWEELPTQGDHPSRNRCIPQATKLLQLTERMGETKLARLTREIVADLDPGPF